MSGTGSASLRRSWLYALLIRALLPRRLTRRYGTQMHELFADLRHDARARAGVRGELAVWWREATQLYRVGRAERGQEGSQAPGSARPGDGRRPPKRRSTGALEGLRFNLTQALRGVRRAPALAALVVLTLALGIGANATMFGVVDRLLLQPPAHVVEAERVVRLYVERSMLSRTFITPSITHPDYTDFTAAAGFAEVAAFNFRYLTVGHGAEATRINGVLTTPSLFAVLGVEAALGRFFSDEENVEGQAAVAVLGHEYWRARGADPDVIGSEILLRGAPHTVIGVAPPGFTGVDLRRVDVWLPLRATASGGWQDSRGWYWLRAVARLADDSTAESAAAEATALHRAGRADDRYYDPQATVVLGSVIEARGTQRSDESVVARWLSGVSLVVLLVACANVANMLLARGIRRRREVGVRMALGVSRARLIGEQLAEVCLLALAGGVAALVVAWWGGLIMRGVLLPDLYWPQAPVNGRVLVFTFGVALAAGVVAGIIPALQASRHDVVDALKGSAAARGRSANRARALLLVGQASLSVVLLIGAGLFVKSMARVQGLDLGLEPDRLVVATPEFEDQGDASLDTMAFYRQALDRLEQLPGVERAAAAAAMPFSWSFATSFEIPGREELPSFDDGGPYIYPVSSGFHATTGIRILRGRGFAAADDALAPRVMIVGEHLAAAYWPDQDPIGQCVRLNEEAGCTEVVGIAEASSRGSITQRTSAQYYVPWEQWSEDFSPNVLVARAAREEPGELAAVIRRELQALSSRLRFVEVRPFRQLIDPQARSWQLGATMFTVFGALALVIASIGLYGVLSFNVAERRHEIGVRSALGASAGGLIALVAGQAARLVAAGLMLGVGAALVATPWIEPLLFEVEARDPDVFLMVALALGAVAALAAALPALRAARVEPVIALR